MDIEEPGKLYTFDWNDIRFSALVDDFSVLFENEVDGSRSILIEDLEFIVRVHIKEVAIPLNLRWEDYWPKELWQLVDGLEEFIYNNLMEMANDGEFDPEIDYS